MPRQSLKNLHGKEAVRRKEKSEKGTGQKEKTKQDRSEMLGKRQQGRGHPEAHFVPELELTPGFPVW